MDKIIKLEIKMSVPQGQMSGFPKKFENLIYTTINKSMRNHDVVSVKVIKWDQWCWRERSRNE